MEFCPYIFRYDLKKTKKKSISSTYSSIRGIQLYLNFTYLFAPISFDPDLL